MRRAVRTAGALTVLAVAGTVLAGCSSSDEEGGATTYLVGAPIVQSGPGAFAGKPVAQGIELAVAEINDSDFLGDGSEIELEIVDTAGDPGKAIAAYRQLEADDASAVLCCTLGGEAGALSPLLRESTVPGVVTVSILDDLADPPYLFRPFEVPSAPGGMYDQFLDTVLPAGDFADAVMVVNDDNDAMVQDAAVYEAGLERNGVGLAKTIRVGTAETSFTGVATEIASIDPDVVVASTIGSSTANLAKALRSRGYDKPIVSNVGADSRAAYDASGGDLAGTIFPTPFSAAFTVNDEGAEFAAAYEEEYGEAPDMFAAQGYTAMWLVATAIRDAGSGDPAEVAEALAAVEEQVSVYGTLSYTDGQAEAEEPGQYLVWGADGSLTPWPA
ncbi:ABC transporter substrate-binding protein [Nocardioides carbamazepini]|uniref:ABC transporter substrate-binding protein n=1 Tax=Nocardioides carbamazepini TaxID=2854259 RepID=UPI00214A61F9|nr:ABC transporter substrate-binding protein [Nocardioides carbamazepini]MCR1781355.1 ABC transporter substrate-binding protein [Nocardioides carbamazepini]